MSQIYDSRAMLLRTHVGEATDPKTDRKFELSLVNTHMAAVKDLVTRKTYVLSWDDLIRQAIAAGVSDESVLTNDLARLKSALEHSREQRYGDALKAIKHIPDASRRVLNVRYELENDAPERAVQLLVKLIRDMEREAD